MSFHPEPRMRYLPATLALALATLFGWHQHRLRSAVEKETTALRSEDAERRRLEAQNRVWAALVVDTNELARLREQKLQLLRLRGRVGELRDDVGSGTGGIAERIEAVRAKTADVQREADLMEARMRAEDLSRSTYDAAAQYAQFARTAAMRNDGRLAVAWEEVRRQLEKPWPPRPGMSPVNLERMRRSYLESFDHAVRNPIRPEAFELLPSPERYEQTNFDVNNRILLLRERVPRPLPDGGWARMYVFLGGHVEDAHSEDGDFSRWEAEAASRAQ